MGREMRKVPAKWEHPTDRDGNYIPLLRKETDGATVEECMPNWPDSECTHFQMYETCTEGTPISPPLYSAEALAEWLADHHASFFGKITAPREKWMEIITGDDPGLPMFLVPAELLTTARPAQAGEKEEAR